MRRLLATPLLLAALAALPPAHAQAQQGVIERAATALRSSPVYVDPAAHANLDAARLRRAIADQGAGPLYIAVLPASAEDEAGGSPEQVGSDRARGPGP